MNEKENRRKHFATPQQRHLLSDYLMYSGTCRKNVRAALGKNVRFWRILFGTLAFLFLGIGGWNVLF